MNKHNYFVIFLNKINLSINSLLEKYLNKLNFKNLLNITGSNKVFLTFVAIIILFLSYLSLPHVYNKGEVGKELQNQLLDRFSLNFIFSKNFNYKFFPRPHFVIEDSSILSNNIKISDIKILNIYVSLDNLFSLKNITINDVVLENANINLDKKSSNFFLKLLENNFLKSSFTIKDSNVFFQNIEQEVLFINKIIDMKYYYDPKELKNIVNSKNEIFNIPYSFKSYKSQAEKKIFTKVDLNILKIQIENENNKKKNLKQGYVDFIYNQNRTKANYEFNKKYFNFNYADKSNDPKFDYKGKINFNPFHSFLKGSTNKFKLSSFFNYNSLSAQFLKTELLNNKNLNFDLSINANKIFQNENFVNIFFNSKIQEGLIDIDNTKFSWDKLANFKISESLIYINNNELILNGKLSIDIKNNEEIYKFFQISKSLRLEFDKLEFNFNYNFDQQTMDLNDVKIDSQINKKVNNVLKKIILKKNKLQNKIYFKNLIREFILAYAG